MTTAQDEFERLLVEIKREEYERGWNAAVASLLAAAQRGGPPPDPVLDTLVLTPPEPQEEGPSIIELVYEGIKSRPGRRGNLIIKDVAARTGGDPKRVDRTARTALSRLKKRGKIWQRGSQWYPVKEEEQN